MASAPRSSPDPSPPRGAIVCVALESEPDDAALAVAADLSRRLARPLVLIDVQVPVPPVATSYPPVAPAPPLPPEVAEPPRPAPRDLEALAARAGAASVRYETRLGNPAAVLVAVAGDPATALVVAPDEGSGALATALGSNPARRALREASRPVVLVPAECREGLADPLRIVIALPADAATPRVLSVAAELAADLDARLILAHPDSGDGFERRLDAARAALPSDMPIEIVARGEDAAEAAETVAAEVGAGLIVIEPPSHGPLISALLGSATHEVASHAHIPLVVVPEEQQ